MSRQRNTRIMATIPDVRCTPEFITSLHAAGMDAVRINSAHVTPATFAFMVNTVRQAAPGVKILMDTKGPEIRTTLLSIPFAVTKGYGIELREGDGESSPQALYIPVAGVVASLQAGSRVLFDDGEVEFEILSAGSTSVRMRALNNGTVGSRKTIAFPGARIPRLPSVSERDREMIEVARRFGIDMIAHSFVRSAADVRAVRELIRDTDIRLYAKIECKEAVADVASIAAEADGILVARGDLGTQIPLPTLPGVQLRCVEVAQSMGRSTMLATQILQSMISRPIPLRAELSDIFLAVAEGIDTLLLTGETAQGKYPVECVDILNQTILQAEKSRCGISMNI